MENNKTSPVLRSYNDFLMLSYDYKVGIGNFELKIETVLDPEQANS